MGRTHFFTFALLALASTMSACSGDTTSPTLRHFDRPSDVAFTCVGSLRLNGSGEVLRSSAMPESVCDEWRVDAPVGQEGLDAPSTYAAVLQSNRGSIAIVNASTSSNVSSDSVLDSDRLSPGKNDIPVGSQPVGLAMDASGCFAVTANAGSCDLSALEMGSAVDPNVPAQVIAAMPILTGEGSMLDARPSDIAFASQNRQAGVACPDSPVGVAYVAFPDCDLVVGVDVATGETVGGIAFDDDGSARLAEDTDIVCANQCSVGDGGRSDATVHPTTLTIEKTEGRARRLLIGADSNANLTVVELGLDDTPSSVVQVPLEGDVGIREIRVSDPIEMGGDIGVPLLTFGPFQFSYIVVSDGTIRVVDLDQLVECDTQVDPRYLKGEEDVAFLSCMPVGDPRTPPRRSEANSPGIELPGIATSLEFATVTESPGDTLIPAPGTLLGTFAFATTSRGQIFIINVDDDNYSDVEDPTEPRSVSIPLAIAHQPRDFVSDRGVVVEDSCVSPSRDASRFDARLLDPPELRIAPDVSATKEEYLPRLRQLACEVSGVQNIVYEQSYAAQSEVRENAFPDVAAVRNETWLLSWEGRVSQDALGVAIDGPTVRRSPLDSDGERLYIDDNAKPFCAAGMQEGDLADIVGCRSDGDCGIQESCYIHPDSTSSIRGGLCVPEGAEDQLGRVCRDFLISRRTYRVEQAEAGTLRLRPKPVVLTTTPLDGCQSNLECTELADEKNLLAFPDHPIDAAEREDEYTYACSEDPYRPEREQRDCLMTCDYDAEAEPDDVDKNRCPDARFCSSEGFCVEGPVPPQACLQTIQRYQLRVGDAFTVIGSISGFLHNRIADASTGICVADPEASALRTGRIPLRPQPCDDDGDPRTGPNPCRTTVSDTEIVVPNELIEGRCVAQSSEIKQEDVPALRFSNPSYTLHLVDVESRGDQDCLGDGQGMQPEHSLISAGFGIEFDLTGGFLNMIVPQVTMALPVSVRMAPDGRIWAIDQGDLADNVSVQRGQIVTFGPSDADQDFSPVSVR